MFTSVSYSVLQLSVGLSLKKKSLLFLGFLLVCLELGPKLTGRGVGASHWTPPYIRYCMLTRCTLPVEFTH